jgi:hypothetical protein
MYFHKFLFMLQFNRIQKCDLRFVFFSTFWRWLICASYEMSCEKHTNFWIDKVKCDTKPTISFCVIFNKMLFRCLIFGLLTTVHRLNCYVYIAILNFSDKPLKIEVCHACLEIFFMSFPQLLKYNYNKAKLFHSVRGLHIYS